MPFSLPIDCNSLLLLFPTNPEQTAGDICPRFLSPPLWLQSQSDWCSFPSIAQSGSHVVTPVSMWPSPVVHLVFLDPAAPLHRGGHSLLPEMSYSSDYVAPPPLSSLLPHQPLLLVFSMPFLPLPDLYKLVCFKLGPWSHCLFHPLYSRVTSSGSTLGRTFMDESKTKVFLDI